jgi:hypothetical protein
MVAAVVPTAALGARSMVVLVTVFGCPTGA